MASVATTVKAGAEQPLYGKAAGNASDALVTFQLPKAAGLFGKSARSLCHGRAFPRPQEAILRTGLAVMGFAPADGSSSNASAWANGERLGHPLRNS